MESVKSIIDAAVAQGASKATLRQLEIIALNDQVLDLVGSLQTELIELQKVVQKQQERIDLLERDHDRVAEVCEDLRAIVCPVEAD